MAHYNKDGNVSTRRKKTMPNHCTNQLIIRSENKELLAQLLESATRDKDADLLHSLAPMPNNEWDYDWCVNNWGTKWDIYDVSYEYLFDDELHLNFCTAWAPPVTALQTGAQRLDFTFELYFIEEGMMFVGKATEDSCEEYVYTFGRPPCEEIPEHILKEFDYLERDYDEYVMDAEDSDLTDDQKEYRKMLREDIKELV
jgi:hypothetical protein